MKRNGMIYLEFEQDKGPYQAGHRAWVPESEAHLYEDVAFEYQPDPQPEPEPEPEIDLPKDLPARNHFLEAEIYSFDEVKQMAEDGNLKDVEGIGASTEHKIEKYLGD